MAAPEHDDELIIPDHPHSDRPNWRPDDDYDEVFDPAKPSSKRLVQFILRPFARLRRLMLLSPELLADIIFPLIPLVQIVEAHLYLEKVARCIDKKMKGQWTCAECGQDVWAEIKPTVDGLKKEFRYVRRDARFCSQACRQKAFRKRKRVTAKASDGGKAVPRDGSTVAESSAAVTPAAE
jgi:hypothetical protein